MAGRRAAGIGLAAGALLLLAVPALRTGMRVAADEIRGAAVVTDGDTIRIGEERIRLYAIDAPERSQSCGEGADVWDCGEVARRRLTELIAGRTVRCLSRDRDRYGRTVSTCSVDGIDLGQRLVEEGLARAFIRYGDDYAETERLAQMHGVGLWHGVAEAPWDYRAEKRAKDGRLEPLAVRRNVGLPEATADCAIKGNVAADGDRVYHLPGGSAYARTRIDPTRGEGYFCDTDAAAAAGFRPVRGNP